MVERQIPAGTKDKLFREAYGSKKVENAVNGILQKRGYQRIETPTIEFAETFSDSQNALYRFFDAKGRMLALRTDFTTPIERVIETTNLKLPMKLSYSGKIFRANPEMRGEQNEVTQAGIELIGFGSRRAEIEALLCADNILKEMQIPDFHFELGHAELYNGLIRELGLDVAQTTELRLLLLDKNISGLAKFADKYPSNLDGYVKALPFLFGEPAVVIEKAKTLLPSDSELLASLSEVEDIANVLLPILSDVQVTIDLGLVPAFDYYSGILFNGFADKISEVFLSGGRYDKLIKRDDEKVIPAVGMGINLDELVQLKYQMDSLAKLAQPSILIHYDWQDLLVAEELQKQTADSQLSLFDTLDEAKAYAKFWHLAEVWHVTDKEINKFKVGDAQ